VLIVIAALVEHGIEDSTSNASVIVAVGLGAAVALFGPLGDNHFFTRLAQPSTAPDSQRLQ
jgi:hypothetical protein